MKKLPCEVDHKNNDDQSNPLYYVYGAMAAVGILLVGTIDRNGQWRLKAVGEGTERVGSV